MLIDELSDYGIPREVIEILKGEGLAELYPPQEEAIKKGLLKLENSFVVSVPTASGKTLIAELLMVRSIIERGGKCLYIVPLRALASEKLEDFKKYKSLGIKVGISTGEYDSADSWLKDYDIIVSTSEKADSLLRHRSPWLEDVNVLVADEIHLINDGGRGPTLEVTIAKLRHLNPNILVLGLSATIQNADEIASWLSAKLVKSDWRPVRLREGVCYDDEVFYNDSTSERVEHFAKGTVYNLALDTLKDGGQSLVFVNTRRSAERFALDASSKTKKLISPDEKEALSKLSEKVLGLLAEPTQICRRLAESIEGGTAFHHAGMEARQRKLVEEAFKSNLIKILSATPTLAAGVNLPARRVVIRDYTRYDVNLGRVPIPVLEYKQFAGRAGRPKYDTEGEAILVAKSPDERSRLLDNYVLAEPEEIYSKLAVESALRTHVLATIAMGYASSLEGLMEFFSKTFFAHQESPEILEGYLTKITSFLEREGFCAKKDDYLVATAFGKRTSELYIDPMSAVVLRDSLQRAQDMLTNEVSYLHAIARTSELGGIYLRQKDYEWCTLAAHEYKEVLLVDLPSEYTNSFEFEEFLSELKMALFLKEWIEERSEEFVLEKYNLGPGDIRGKVDRSGWLLYSMAEIGRLFKIRSGELIDLHERIRHGVKKELLELVSLRGIGRARARNLYARGFKTLDDIKVADVEKLAGVRLIGKKMAESVKDQAGGGDAGQKDLWDYK
ncbi:MAG: ATP-dependent DNA helicase [Candidatus Hydrothermarchaeales archaeon]